jgi:hypothetical protein
VLLKYNGHCAGCGVKITAGVPWDADHIRSLINGGENRESNFQPLCRKTCHKTKTKADTAEKAAIYKKRLSNYGLKKPKGRPMPGSKASGFKKKLDGSVVRR